MTKNCKDCGGEFTAKPYQRQCPVCKLLKRLWNGMWNRLIYSPKYAHLPIEGVVSWSGFLAWGQGALRDFLTWS
jgi:hypothetical protein